MGWVNDWEPDECICTEQWARNQKYVMGIMRWWCPAHGIVTPNLEGKPFTHTAVDVLKRPRKLEYPSPDRTIHSKQLRLLGD